MMPSSAQNLYFHLGMNADDDGFCEHFSVMRMTDSKPDDLKILQAKEFVNVFDDRVLVILDWKENNHIQKDRYTPSKYLEVYKQEILNLSEKSYMKKLPLNECIQNVSKMDTQVRLGKDRLVYNNASSTKLAINKNSLINKLSLKQPVKGNLNQWQDEAANAKDVLKCPPEKISALFKCFKDNRHSARIALSDCKELGKNEVMYFFKVFSEINKKQI